MLVPNRQRAVAVRLAWAHARLAAGARSWAAPDVLPLDSWLQRCVDEARAGLLAGLRRLGAHEQWLEWRAAALEAGEGLGLLQPGALADSLREAARLQRDWGLPTAAQNSPEGQLYAQARAALAARCRLLRAVQADDWVRLLERATPAGRPLLLAGFESLGQALAERLGALGAQRLAPPSMPAPPGPVVADRVIQARDLDDELQQAARWCRERLLVDPGARLLVVVLPLAQCRPRASRAFGRALQAGALLGANRPEATHVVEGGQALADYPMVQAALSLLALCGGEQAFADVSRWLRSSYLGLGGLAARTTLELALRERNVAQATLERLPALARRLLPPSQGEPLAAALGALQSAVAAWRGARADAGAWARHFAQWLPLAGWPGHVPLGSDEQQQRERFEELLGELAQLAGCAGALKLADAAALLAQLAQRTLFEPASGDVPVTLTASTSDPLVHYDGIWVAGLNAEQWPRPAHPDPFLGVAGQRAAGIPGASAEGQAALAQAAMQAWRARSGQLVLSCARIEGDAELQPSSLLGLGAPPEPPPALPVAAADALQLALQAGAQREPLPPLAALPLADQEGLPGGTRALGLQAECPFHAFAELRLGARALREPEQGLPARERGLLLHSALQAVWSQLAGSAGLRQCQGEARAALVAGAVAAAIAGLQSGLVMPPSPALLAVEARRLQALILQLLAAEQQRSDFVVTSLEGMVSARLGEVPIDVRLDRLDELLDAHGARTGRTVVIDYKSGGAAAFDALAERPGQAQLLAYAVLAPGELAAIALVHMRRAKLEWRGATELHATLPGLPRKQGVAGPQWHAWRAHWARVVPALARQMAEGVARVDPLQQACRNCHLPALCRVGASAHLRGGEEPASADDPVADAQGGAAGATLSGAGTGAAGAGDD